jgi:hypothetical protein
LIGAVAAVPLGGFVPIVVVVLIAWCVPELRRRLERVA